MSVAVRVAIAGLLAVLVAAGAEPAERDAGEEVRGLILQLGAARFDDREAASRRLGEIGAPALPALREATRSRDAEVRARDGRLVGEIQAVVNRKGREALGRRLARIRGTERGHLEAIDDELLARTFPGYQFYGLRFRQHPVALAPPRPLKPSNLFAVRPDGTVERLHEESTFATFFRAALDPVEDEEAAREAARAWLRMAEELHQDGFYRFAIPEESLEAGRSDGRLEVDGRAVVIQGGTGEVRVHLAFDESGKLARGRMTADLRPGPRPR